MTGANGRERRWRRVGIASALALCVAVAVTAAGLVRGWDASRQRQTAAVSRVAVSTTPVIRQNLVEAVTLPGIVGYGPTFTLDVKIPGTITWLAPAQATIGRGAVFARVDDKPVVGLIGELPMFRPLSLNTTGRDVRQLETNLRTLGYDGFAVDDRFTAGTVAAVKRWQLSLGLDQTGSVEMGRVAYLSAPVRVAGALVRPGAGSPASVLTVSGTTRSVTAALTADSAGWAVRGATVTVTGASGRSSKGSVTLVGAANSDTDTGRAGGSGAAARGTGVAAGGTGVAAGGTGGAAGDAGTGAAVPVTISVSDEGVLGTGDQSQVQITHTVRQRVNVLTVPVAALLALAEGGYGLELAGGSRSRIVAVKTGMFAQGRVEVSAPSLRDGLLVEIAA